MRSLLPIMCVSAIALPMSASASSNSLTKRVYQKVNQTHAHERRLHARKTPYAHVVTPYSLRQWTRHEHLWARRLADPHWILRATFPPQARAMAACIISHESGWQRYAHNPSGASSYFQLMPFWFDGENSYGWRFDVWNQWQHFEHAALLYKRSGWSQWVGDPCVS